MHWYELAENPQAILAWYTHVPPLRQIEMETVDLYEANSRVVLSIDSSTLPDKTPPKWNPNWDDTVSFGLEFLGIEAIQIVGSWSLVDPVDIEIERTATGYIKLMANLTVTRIEFIAHSFTIVNVHGYRQSNFL